MNPSGPDVWVVTGPGLVADARPLAEVAAREFEALGVSGKVTPAAEVPEVYRRSSPLERLPLGVPHLVVQGSDDDLDLVDVGRRYARAAHQSGDDVTYLEISGDHFDVIDPAFPIWRAAAEAVAEHVVRPTR